MSEYRQSHDEWRQQRQEFERAAGECVNGGNTEYACCQLNLREGMPTARTSTELAKKVAADDSMDTTPQLDD